MPENMQTLHETVNFIRQKISGDAPVAIILGSGLGNLSNDIKAEFEISYNDIPHFPVSTVEGHKGRLIFGELGGKKVWVMAGRFHYYEGYTAQQVSYPVRVLRLLGADTFAIECGGG